MEIGYLVLDIEEVDSLLEGCPPKVRAFMKKVYADSATHVDHKYVAMVLKEAIKKHGLTSYSDLKLYIDADRGESIFDAENETGDPDDGCEYPDIIERQIARYSGSRQMQQVVLDQMVNDLLKR